MKTIPSAWKPTGDRDDWYNNNGTPILFIRVLKVNGEYFRMSTFYSSFKEEGGVPRLYDDKFLKMVTPIDQKLNTTGKKVGATSQMSQLSITINNGEIENEQFTDLCSLNSLVNAKVEIWLCFKECSEYSIDNSMKFPCGLISGFHFKGDVITLKVNEYSHLKQKEIPYTVKEFHDKYPQTPAWTIPETHKNKIIPITIGEGIFKLTAVSNPITVTTTKFAIGHPIPDGISTNGKMLYWVDEVKNYKGIKDDAITLARDLPSDIHTAQIDSMWLMPEEARGLIRIQPYDITEIFGSCFGDKDAIKDGAIGTIAKFGWTIAETDVAYVGHNTLTFETWISIWKLKFKRDLFPKNLIFDIYVCGDYIYAGANENPKARWGFDPTNITDGLMGYLYPARFDLFVEGEGGSQGRGSFATRLMSEVGSDCYRRNTDEYYVKVATQANYNDLTADDIEIMIKLWREDADDFTRTYQCHECYIAILPLPPLRDFYIQGAYGNDTFQDAIKAIFDSYLGLPSGTYTSFLNFARNYDLDGQINKRIDSHKLLSTWAEEFGIIFNEDEDGIAKFIDINSKAADYSMTDDDIVEDKDGILQMEYEKYTRDVYSRFEVNYKLNIATKEYETTRYVTKGNNNLTELGSTRIDAMTDLCQDAYDDFDTDKKISINLDFVRGDESAEEILEKLVLLFTMKPDLIRVNSIALRCIDLELGDQIDFNCRDYTAQRSFLVLGKRTNYAQNISFELLELPWLCS